VVQSLADQCNPCALAYSSTTAFTSPTSGSSSFRRPPPATFDGVDAAAFGVVTSTTIRFLQMSLEDVATSADLMVAGDQRPATARIFVGVNGPSLKNIAPVREECGPN